MKNLKFDETILSIHKEIQVKLKKTNITVHLLDDRLYKVPKNKDEEIILTNNKQKNLLTVQIQKTSKII